MAIKNTVPQPATSSSQRSDVLRIANLAFGDVLAFVVFAVIGINSHKESLNVQHVVVTVLPFLLGWFLIAPFIRVYRRNVTEQPAKMARHTALAWLLACPIALALRGLLFEHIVPQTSFMLIAFLSNMVFLLIWRVPYAWSKSKKKAL